MFKDRNFYPKESLQKNENKNLFDKDNHFEIFDKYFPQYPGLSISDLALQLKDDYQGRFDKLDRFFDELLFEILWWEDAEKAKLILALMVHIYGAETTRGMIIEWIDETLPMQNNKNQECFLMGEIKLHSLITPNHDKIAITNLKKFYSEKIKFEDYEINKKMNARELALLQNIIPKDKKVLEMGCGTGRLLLEMKKSGYDVSGLDFVQRHIDYIQKQDSEVNVFQADWHDTKLPDQSQDVIYSLGRNILHDYSFVDQIQLFRETSRLLKAEGKFIFDIPNREKGGYKEMVSEYESEMKKRGIRIFVMEQSMICLTEIILQHATHILLKIFLFWHRPQALK